MSDDWPEAIGAGWHPVATSAEVGRRPLARTLMGDPLVVFRGEDRIAVLRDRCPHRGMPLSCGRVVAGTIACPYHGWRFDEEGICQQVPGAPHPADARARALPVVERGGLIWTSLADRPAPFPDLPSAIDDPSLDRFWWAPQPTRARVLDALENHLDPAHPHHVHPWLVRSSERRRPVSVQVEITPDGAQATYREDTRPGALVPRLLEGKRTVSVGRLFPPTIGEVAFYGSQGLAFSIAVIFVPVAADIVRPFAHFATPRRLAPARVKRLILKAAHWPILMQDRRALARQADRPAGGYRIGPLDFLGPAIWGFANGRPPPPKLSEHEVYL